MNWFTKMFKKASGRGFRFVPQWFRTAFMTVTNRRLLDGYKKNSAVSACVTRLAFSFPEAPLLVGVEEEGRFKTDYRHELMELIRQPNPDMGEAELAQFAITYASVGGNLYLWKQRRKNGQVMHLWPFSNVNVTPLPGRTTAEGLVRGYEYDPGDGQKVIIPKADMIHWKWMPDPEQPWRGIGAIEFAVRDSDRTMEADAYVYSLLKNNAVPPVVVTLAEGDTDFDEKKADRMREQWGQKMGGDNRGKLAFIEYGMKAEKMGFNLQELAAEALSAVPEARIAAAFGVPPVVAGLSVGLKRSDYGDQAARRSFTELTLMALWRSYASELYKGLKDDFDLPANYRLKHDLRQVGALQEEESKRWERVTLAFERSGLTRAEMKEELGMEPGPGDDVYKVSLATEFVSADKGEVDRTPLSSGDDIPPNGKTHLGGDNTKGLRAAGEGLRRIRVEAAGRMKQALDVYFRELGNAVVERLEGEKDLTTKSTKSTKGTKEKLPGAESLITQADGKKLGTVIKRYYVQVIELSWEMWNLSLGIELAFDLTDPIVTRVLKTAGKRVKLINQETLSAVREALEYANEQGWSIDDLVRGDETQRGLREVVQETYKDRARTIARTELGEAQNQATVERYKEAGVSKVEILDNGSSDDDVECQVANGQIWALKYFNANKLEHPNCTRAAAPYFGDREVDRG